MKEITKIRKELDSIHLEEKILEKQFTKGFIWSVGTNPGYLYRIRVNPEGEGITLQLLVSGKYCDVTTLKDDAAIELKNKLIELYR